MKKDMFLSVSCIFICSFVGLAASEGYTYYPPKSAFKSVNFWMFGDQNLKTPEVSEKPNEIDVKIEKYMEKVRENMPVGFPEMSLPPLDPLSIPDMVKDVDLGLFRGKVSVTDISMTGLKEFKVNSIRFVMSDMSAVFDITVPTAKAEVSYGVNGHALTFVPLGLEGKSVVNVYNIRVTGVMKMKISLFGPSLENYKINFSLGDYNIHLLDLTNFPLIDGIVDWVVKMVSTTFINHHQKQLSKLVDQKIEEVAKYVFEHIKVKDIID